jgi:hypothetical protein
LRAGRVHEPLPAAGELSERRHHHVERHRSRGHAADVRNS